MPVYEYECSNCGYVFEARQRITDPPLKKCPKCEGKLIKLIPKRTMFLMNNHTIPTRTDMKRMEKQWKGKARI